MDRLTDRRSNGVIKRSDALGESVMRRLADYEDTGLSPDEVTSMIAENTRLRAELEAAERDIKHFLQLSRDDWMSGDEWCGLCEMCEHVNREVCKSCDDAEWRGVAENGGTLNE